jgi:hypothetical protein
MMNREEFTDLLSRKAYAYHAAGNCVVVTHGGAVNLRSLSSLPEGVTFENGGAVNLASLSSLPEGVTFKNGGAVNLRSLSSLPEGVTFKNGSYVNLASLSSLPEGVTFENGGYVDLDSLTSLPEGVTFKNGGAVYLDSLTSLPEGVTFENGGSVYLRSLSSLPEGVTFKNGGYVDLDSLTSLPEGVTFENGGAVNLRSLTGPYVYQGKTRQFRHIDGSTMLMGSSRSQGDHTVWTARYLRGGPVADLPKCYVAERDGVFAHGETVRAAVEDLEYKLTDRANVAEVASQVRDSGRVTLPQFRAITGACREGIRAHLRDHGVDLETTDFLPLDRALSIMAGTSYGDTFRKAMEATQ